MQTKQTPFRKIRRAMSKTDFETWGGADVSNTLNTHDVSDVFSVNLVVEERCDDCYCKVVSFDRATYNQGKHAQYDMGIADDGIAQTVIAKGAGGDRVCNPCPREHTIVGTMGSFMEFKTDVAPEICVRDYKSPLCIVDAGGRGGLTLTPQEMSGTCSLKKRQRHLPPGSCPGYHDGVVIKEKEMDCTNCDKGCKLVVRRLTPIECGRLQAMPDWWLTNLAIEDPSDEDIAFWLDAWNTWQSINNKPKKNEKFIRKWLKNPYADSSAYKLYGNGMCFANCLYVLGSISAYANGEL